MSTIQNVSATQPIASNSPPDWRTSIGQILVTIETDDGLTGYGVGGGGRAGIHVVESVLKPLLLGENADPVEAIWDAMDRAVLPFGPEGIAMMAVSGIDLALWDLRGKRADLPVAKLLNPECDLTLAIPTYQTVWDAVPKNVVLGRGGVKLHMGASSVHGVSPAEAVNSYVARVATAREAIGYERSLMVDAWMTWDVATTLRFAEKADQFNIEWIEEPLPLTDMKGYEQLCRECPIPIAGGEHVFTARNFAPLIENRLHSVLQPDACWVGGMTEMVKIFAMAGQAGVKVIPHRGAELWGLHSIAGLSKAPLAESGRPWMNWVGGQPQIIDGMITLAHDPGFGVSILDAVTEL